MRKKKKKLITEWSKADARKRKERKNSKDNN